LRISFGSALALAAGPIVVLIRSFFNCRGLNVGVGPSFKLQSVEANTLFSDREFPYVWPNGFIEFVPAHAEIAVCLTGANKPREDSCNLSWSLICHNFFHTVRGGRSWGGWFQAV